MMDIQENNVAEMVNSFSIKWIRVRIEYELNKSHDFDFIAPMIRGALGYSLNNTYCVNKNTPCAQCKTNSSCIYFQLFESPIYKGNQVKDFFIHPFQISLDPLRIGYMWNNRRISFYLTLFGQPEMLYPVFIKALKRAGTVGLGKFSIKAERMTIYDLEDRPLGDSDTFSLIPPPVFTVEDVNRMIEKDHSSPSGIRIKFLTPVQVKTDGKVVKHMDFSLFVLAAARRLNLIEKFYGGDNRILSEQLLNAGGAIKTVESDLKWVYHFRYSTRKKKNIPLPGIVGDLSVSGDVKRFLVLLVLGEIFHIGGKTTFGLGQFLKNVVL